MSFFHLPILLVAFGSLPLAPSAQATDDRAVTQEQQEEAAPSAGAIPSPHADTLSVEDASASWFRIPRLSLRPEYRLLDREAFSTLPRGDFVLRLPSQYGADCFADQPILDTHDLGDELSLITRMVALAEAAPDGIQIHEFRERLLASIESRSSGSRSVRIRKEAGLTVVEVLSSGGSPRVRLSGGERSDGAYAGSIDFLNGIELSGAASFDGGISLEQGSRFRLLQAPITNDVAVNISTGHDVHMRDTSHRSAATIESSTGASLEVRTRLGTIEWEIYGGSGVLLEPRSVGPAGTVYTGLKISN